MSEKLHLTRDSLLGLLRGLDATAAKALWRLLPDNLRSLHVALWGRPDFARR